MNLILHERFQRNLRDALESRGMSQSKLARDMNATPQYVSNYLSGRVCPGLDVVQRFADALHCDPVELLKESEVFTQIA